jgi:hypothetical protein
MTPSQNGPLWAKAKYAILSDGDEILAGDEYYNPIKDKWLPVEKNTVGDNWDSDHYKPIRRRAGSKVVNHAKRAYNRLEKILGKDYEDASLVCDDLANDILDIQNILYKGYLK